MNKRLYVIFAVFALIISCKNYASSEDLKQNFKKQVKGFLDTKKEELVGGLTNLTLEVCSKGQSEEQVVQGTKF
ncbi:hypothetical protein DB723_05215 (plasmid) [Borrelia maritima]|uniref:Uncharacterized protein n=1 Tax=Borrelia maritima TaxID=2761123 RepID=A0A5J6WCL4_9SPIR|nr:hypothetical protein [Borrelia maritima]QFI15096.1 hypothetical protein DB723_05215 [Borrelia maritima]